MAAASALPRLGSSQVSRRTTSMAILVVAEIPGGTVEGAKEWAERGRALVDQPGFLFHADGPIEGGWRVLEVWESEGQWRQWFDTAIKPNLPPGAREYTELARLAQVVHP